MDLFEVKQPVGRGPGEFGLIVAQVRNDLAAIMVQTLPAPLLDDPPLLGFPLGFVLLLCRTGR